MQGDLAGKKDWIKEQELRMAELAAAYTGKFTSAKNRDGQTYTGDRARLTGEDGYLLLYRERASETLRFVPERSSDEMLEIPCGRRTEPLHSDTLLFETANSVYTFQNVRRIR